MKPIFLLAVLISVLPIRGEEVALQVERSTTITFASENNRAYKLLAAETPSGTWSLLKDGIAGTGEDVIIFYKSEGNQKLFFKVETSDGPPGQRSLISQARLDVSYRNLAGYDLEGADLREYKFYGCTLDKANLVGADLRGAGFQNATMRGADLRNVVLGNTSFYGVDLAGANLSGVNMAVGGINAWTGANLEGAKLQGARLPSSMPGVKLANTDLTGVSFRGVDLSNADLTGATLTGANMEGAELSGVHMAGRDLRTVFLRGAGVGGGANWSGVNLAGSDLTLLNAGNANLAGANLSGANLTGFRAGQSITGVNFQNARLLGASFVNCDVSNCDFTGADLSYADFRGADLTGSTGLNFEQAGMRFGPRTYPFPGYPPGYPDSKYSKGTILPDSTTRTGDNPGVPLGAPVVPARLVLNIDDNGRKETTDLAFAGNRFSYGPGAPSEGIYHYYPGPIVSTLTLHPGNGNRYLTLLFTSPAGGQLYESDYASDGITSAGILVGTFQVP